MAKSVTITVLQYKLSGRPGQTGMPARPDVQTSARQTGISRRGPARTEAKV